MRKTFKLFGLMATFALALVGKTVWADAAAAPAATPAAPTVTVNGLVDTYFTYNFANSSAAMNGAGNVGTFFDTADNSFSLGLAEVDVNVAMGNTSGHISLDYGQEGNLGLLGQGLDVLQAYVSYAPDQWTFSAGRFVTWMGNEVIQSKANMNYSRSLLFWYTIPLWHQGLSVGFAPDAKLGITAYATDGWNNTASPFIAPVADLGKTYGLQVKVVPDSTISVILNGIAGPQGGVALGTYNGAAHYVAEAIISFVPNSTWSFALDGEYGGVDLNGPVTLASSTINSTTFWGLALYGRYQIASDWAGALRLEMVKDAYNTLGMYAATPQGPATDVAATEGTLTIEHNFSSNLLLRLEGRVDMASSGGTAYSATTTPPGPFAGGVGTQATGTASAVFSF